jgi:lipopolysaccharide transport system permease protein
MSLESGHHEVTTFGSRSVVINPITLVADMLRDIGKCRQLAGMLAIRDLKAQHRQSFFGVLWMIVPPLAWTIGLTVLRKNNVINLKYDGPSPELFWLISMAMWQMFTEAVRGPLQAMNMNRGILTKVRFPREAIVMADIIKLGVATGIQLLLIGAALIYYLFGAGANMVSPDAKVVAAEVASAETARDNSVERVDPDGGSREPLRSENQPAAETIRLNTSMLLFPLAALVLLLFGTVLGLLLAPIGLLYKDIGNSLPFAIQALFTITPVVFAMPAASNDGWWAAVVRLNPVTPIIVTARELMFGEALTQLPQFLIVAGLAAGLLIFAMALLRIAMPLVIERWSS